VHRRRGESYALAVYLREAVDFDFRHSTYR
jgi:hypothetical protein